MLIRTYALYGRNNRLLAWLIGFGACLIAMCSWTVHGQDAIPVNIYPGCHLGVSRTTGYHLSASWIALFLFDTTIFSLTMFRTYITRRRLGVEAGNLPLHRLMSRDVRVFQLANSNLIGTLQKIGPLLRGSLSTFANCISVSMISRLMLNLHDRAGNAGILSQINQYINQYDFGEDIPFDAEELVGSHPPSPPIPPPSSRAAPSSESEVPEILEARRSFTD
ncbi:hypothetical protein DFH07DRAFT_942773 [Mycena maculata]|uniref:Uncharacterized protein n=1 Tax=Mycena maculata TaxID=230809 RepID=A0AAD7IP63_9AGAR|nr:hypothetical protein DFH07DRAFT_942773 [Mycena maculata]